MVSDHALRQLEGVQGGDFIPKMINFTTTMLDFFLQPIEFYAEIVGFLGDCVVAFSRRQLYRQVHNQTIVTTT